MLIVKCLNCEKELNITDSVCAKCGHKVEAFDVEAVPEPIEPMFPVVKAKPEPIFDRLGEHIVDDEQRLEDAKRGLLIDDLERDRIRLVSSIEAYQSELLGVDLLLKGLKK